MDEGAVRQAAEDHAGAVVEGDLRRAARYLTDEVMLSAQRLMSERFPTKLESGEVLSVETAGEQSRARIRYAGEGQDVTVESVWAERDGRPKIVALDAI